VLTLREIHVINQHSVRPRNEFDLPDIRLIFFTLALKILTVSSKYSEIFQRKHALDNSCSRPTSIKLVFEFALFRSNHISLSTNNHVRALASTEGLFSDSRALKFLSTNTTMRARTFPTWRQCCGSETFFFGSGSHFPSSFGSGSYLTSKKFRIQFRIRP
jgi:hypothetical protein